MKTLNFPTAIKKAPTDGSGRGTALVYVFGGKDTNDPVIDGPGPFQLRRPDRLPMYWQHDYTQPENAIGSVTQTRTTAEGLEIDFQLDLVNPQAQRVYEGLLSATLGEFSIGFDYPTAAVTTGADGREHVPASKVELVEISVVAFGAARSSRLISIKAAPTGTLGAALRLEDEHRAADTLRSTDDARRFALIDEMVARLSGLPPAEHQAEINRLARQLDAKALGALITALASGRKMTAGPDVADQLVKQERERTRARKAAAAQWQAAQPMPGAPLREVLIVQGPTGALIDVQADPDEEKLHRMAAAAVGPDETVTIGPSAERGTVTEIDEEGVELPTYATL